MILTPFNYHEWKSKIGIVLCSKGLYRVTLSLENEPNVVTEKAKKWHNRLDEAYGFLILSISIDILFHIDGFTTPNQVCTEIEALFEVQYEIRAHQLEKELFSLSPRIFYSIEGFFTKFKSFVLMLKQGGVENKEYKLIIFILSKLGLE